MAKSSFFTGQPVFSQILSLIPRSLVSKLAQKHGTDFRCKRFRSYDHVVTMLYAAFHKCVSIREVVTGMQACALRLRHLGITSTPRRSTLADAAERRSADFFQELYHEVYRHYYGSLPDSRKAQSYLDRLYIIDSTTFSLFSTVLQGAGCYGTDGKKKGGVKAHMAINASENVGCFIRLTEGKANDNTFLPRLHLPSGSIVVFDKGYRNYRQLQAWTEQGITWVTRLQAKAVTRVVKQRKLHGKQLAKGVQKDEVIELGNPETAHINAVQKARLIHYIDEASGHSFEFLTNNFQFAPATIASMYKKRWQIELLFKRLKSGFQLKYFMGDNANAIQVQLWCTLLADLLLKVIKDKADRPHRKWSMANLTALMRLHLSTYIKLFAFLEHPEKALLGYEDPYDKAQLNLFPASG